MRNILLINSLAGGGAERQVSSISKYLKIHKIFLLERGVKYTVNSDLEILLNYTFKSSIIKTFLIPFYAFLLARKIKQNDIIVSFLERSNFVNIFTKLLFKSHKCIICERTYPSISFQNGLKKINKIFIRYLYRYADQIITNSYGVKSDLMSNFKLRKQNIKVIYNFFDEKRITLNTRENLGSIDQIFLSPTIINIGRLSKPKGQWHLIRIFASLKEKIDNSKLVILGEGPLKDYLIKLSRSYQLRTYSIWNNDIIDENYDIYFFGFQNNPFSFIHKSTIFILTSLWEGFPNVLVEAMFCGVPVVSTDCRSGPREILSPNSDLHHQTEKMEFGEFGILLPAFDGNDFLSDSMLTDKERLWEECLGKILKDEVLLERYRILALKRAKHFSDLSKIQIWNEILYGS